MDNNKKLINLANLAKLSKSLDDRCKDSVNEVKTSIDEAKAEFLSEIARVEAMLGGRSIRYVTQDEYDALSPAEKNSDTVVYFVTDDMGDDGTHDHDDLYFTKEEIEALLAALPDNDHTHDEYYTTTTIDSMLSNKSDKDHAHSDYATKDEVEALGSNVDKELAKKADKSEIPSLENYYNKNDVDGIKENLESTIAGEVAALNSAIGGKADEGHNHNTLYHTKEYINANFYTKNDIDGTVSEINANKADKTDLASYYTKTEVNGIKSDILEDINDLQEELSTELDNTKTELADHKHDDDYYTKNEINTKFNNVAEKEHDHDNVYATKEYIQALETNYELQFNDKADKSELSRFDNYYNKTQVDGFVSNLESSIAEEVATLNGAIATAKTNAINSAKSYTDTAISNLVDSAPEAMNTLNELAQAIKDHNDEYTAYVATVASNIATAKAEAIADAAAKDTALHTTITTEINGKIEDINEDIDGKVAEIIGTLEVLYSTKLDTNVATTHFIQSSLSQEGEAYDSHMLYKGEKIISPVVNINTVIDDGGNTLTDYLSYFDTSINALTASIGDGNALLTDAKDTIVSCINELQTEINNLDSELDTKVEDINESINEHAANLNVVAEDLFNLQANVIALDTYKADISYVNGKLEVVDAIKLNGYSLWVGTTAELEAITERDPNTLYFEIDDGAGEEVVQVNIVNGVLQLTDDKYQKTNMLDGTTIAFPAVNRFTEIHLYFTAGSNMNINLPDNCKWRVEPNIEEGNSYEIVAIYNTIEWLVNVIVYS